MFVLFSGSDYYPDRPSNDFVDKFDDIDSARFKAIELKDDWFEIYEASPNKFSLVETHKEKFK